MTEPTNREDAASLSEPGRRSLLGMLAVFAALTLFVVSISLTARMLRPNPAHGERSAPREQRSREPDLDPRIEEFLGPIATNRRFDEWRITRLDPLQFGRVTLEIEAADGARYVLDVHARSPEAPPPIAETAFVAIYARTNGGSDQTPAPLVRACTALANALRAREEAGHTPPPLEPMILR